MQPNDTPAISRFNAQAVYNGETWTITEQHNTIGTISEGGTSTLTFTSSSLFTLNQTSVKLTGMRSGTGINASLQSLSATTIEIILDDTVALSDTVLVEIEVFNT